MSRRTFILVAGALILGWVAAQPVHAAEAKKAEQAEAKEEAKVAHLAENDGPELDPQTKCLALTVFWEGRAETPEGQTAIAHTVLNRSRDGKFPDGICGVITQGDNDGKPGCQFSWWCDGKSDQPDNPEQWALAVEVARQALADGSPDPTNGALYFHNGGVVPEWAKKRKRLVRIGNHVFYR
jgi:spore germination cell wall hydrolase CwlJ-like protein